MPVKWRGPLPWLAAAFASDVIVTVAATFFLTRGVVDHEELIALALVSLAGAFVLFAVSWKIVEFLTVRSIRRMAAEVRAIAYGAGREAVDAERYAMISPLPEAVNEVCARMIRARTDLSDGLSAATRKSEENSSRLAAILNDLHEGVVVCNQRHQLVLYNQVAFDILRGTAELGLGRSLFVTLAKGPVVHMFDVLGNRPDMAIRGMPFLVGTTDDRVLLQARMTLIRGEGGTVTGYVITLVDAGPQLAALAGREALLRDVAEDVEAPLRRMLDSAGDEALVRREGATIAEAIRRVTEGYQRMLSGWWPMADINSTEFLSFVVARLGDEIRATVIGLPVWLHGDSHSLVLAVESLVRRTADQVGAVEFDLSAGGGEADEGGAWVEFAWAGGMVEPALIDRWLAQPLAALGGMTVGDVLQHHAGARLRQDRLDGGGALRLPMRRGIEQHGRARQPLPGRPEFYDLSLLEQGGDAGALGGRPLRSLTYVVFDTETTGLHPSQGDRIVSIAGIRIVNGRILSGESFNRIVNPGRPIPAESVQFHGITDDMVKDKPPVEVVLPQFRNYIEGSVLVAHNAAFDLKFLRMREQEMGLRFDNWVLDTMILSNFLDGPELSHSLDAICERYGIEITDRHTALGDAMVTAAVLLRQIEALEARGIDTLDKAFKTLNIAMILHERQRVL
ncbi:exonuclease domain-containing protein [Magnetospirillum sp. SS-4]|uniref:3'-5' exonuclease n=1 Tax=Magnetospirillum sp. SS-4 TaxID=2681465 RepID=UPI00138131CF|nr:exonuclease domain-containing protein [Magnetospirillum sp. SS-4]CAA7617988.1 DNA polymerase III [Magnetospirillum sp. SS-4]